MTIRKPRREDLVGGLLLLLLAGFATGFVHALLVARYQPFAELGEPPLVPVGTGAARTSQIGAYAYFHSEAAFHFRTTLMFAVDDYQHPDLLHEDNWQQYPDGVDAWMEYGLLMEPVYGAAYRLLHRPGQSLASFLLAFVPVVYALTALLAWLLARVAGAGRVAALAGLLSYALSPLTFHAILTSTLIKETFSLLLMAGFLAAHLRALHGRGRIATLTAAALLGAFLVSWHLAQFLAAVVLAGTLAAWATGRHDRNDRAWQLPAAYLLAALVAGNTPMLDARGFLFTPPMAPLYVWLLGTIAVRIWPARLAFVRARIILALGALAVLIAAGQLAQTGGDYSHVYGLLREQIAHGFVKPADPAELPFAVRLFWVPPFTPPPAQQWLGQTGMAGALAFVTTLYLFATGLRPAAGTRRRTLAWIALGLLGVWALSERLGPVFWLLVPAIVAVALEDVARWRPRAGRLAPGLAAALLLLNVPLILSPLLRTAWAVTRGQEAAPRGLDRTEAADRAALFEWISSYTPGPGSMLPGDPPAFAADIALSPDLLLYAARPIFLNSQFENEPIRDRAEAWLGTLFESEPTDLLAQAARYGVKYVVVDRDLATATGRRSMRYMAGDAGAPNLTDVAGRMHFQPESLPGLTPVYENARYRVFAVGKTRPAGPPWQPAGGRWWNPANYRIEDGVLTDPVGDRANLQKIDNEMRSIRSRLDRLAARLQGAAGASATPLRELRGQEAQLRDQGIDTPPDLQRGIDAWMQARDPRTGHTLEEEFAAILDGEADDPGLLPLLAIHAPEPADVQLAAQLCLLAGRFEQAAALGSPR